MDVKYCIQEFFVLHSRRGEEGEERRERGRRGRGEGGEEGEERGEKRERRGGRGGRMATKIITSNFMHFLCHVGHPKVGTHFKSLTFFAFQPPPPCTVIPNM